MDRDRFLERVRSGLEGVIPPPLPEALPRTFASGDGRLFDRFADELSKVGGEARWIRSYEIADTVATVADGAARAVVAPGIGSFLGMVEEGLRRAGCEAMAPTREAAGSARLGVTGAELGVASTGSVLLRMGPEAPRVASLLPPIHLVLLPAERLIPGFEELFAVWPESARAASQTVLITGPSRTTDIERTLVRGVHGPTRVVVLVIAP